ncbi:Alternative N-terminal open reading frame of ZYX-1 [Caenorhabditis elegans]|uniref:Alternative N-terminal open reading frame of ZYX-1 n=1 Tax=Caenorhabditis elegans TaxID=6239 RepID=A0A9J5HVW4_CAEEL|nr:Alternative N-terminal open reading frame of ZYX-1 [Caenorhabditis elegans]CAI3857288.1 Alternative N-terminal open reading frame of ZYX-1 [Caenorhabditis elegans]
MSYLSPLPHYPSQSLGRARSFSTIPDSASATDLWDPRLRLHHPLYSHPERYYHLANGRQRMHHDVTTIPHLRRPSRPVPQWTLRHYSTPQHVCVRPATTNRFEVTSRIYPMDDWTDRINNCLTEIGRIARTSNNWLSRKPEQRFLLRPLIPTNLVRSATFIETPMR